MNIRLLPIRARAATLIAVFACGTTLFAVTQPAEPGPRATGENSFAPLTLNDPQTDRREKVYHLLARTERDADGHIAQAMKHVKTANTVVGGDIHTDDPADKIEGDVDEHLRTVREMLRLVHQGLVPVKSDKKALVYVEAAIKEIAAVLKKRGDK